MSEFDPYLKWLGIRDDERPPNHYLLLGLEEFESDRDVISNASDRQMTFVRSFQNGSHPQYCQQILNELSRARRTLLSDEKKAAYDNTLRQKRTAESRPQQPTLGSVKPAQTQSAPSPVSTSAQAATPPVKIQTDAKSKSRSQVQLVAIGIVAAVLIFAIGLFAMNAMKGDPREGKRDKTAQQDVGDHVDTGEREQNVQQENNSQSTGPGNKENGEANDPEAKGNDGQQSTESSSQSAGSKTQNGIDGSKSNQPEERNDAADNSKNANSGDSNSGGTNSSGSSTGNDGSKGNESGASESPESSLPFQITKTKVLTDFSNSAFEIELSPDGQYLVAAGADDNICLWRVANWELVAVNKSDAPGKIFDLIFSADGSRIFTAGDGGFVLEMDASNLRRVRLHRYPGNRTHRLMLDPNDGTVIAASDSNKLFRIGSRVTEIADGDLDGTVFRGLCAEKDSIYSVNSSKSKGESEVLFWNADLSRKISLGHVPGEVNRVKFGKDKSDLLLPGAGTATIFNADLARPTKTWELGESTDRIGDFVYWPEHDVYLATSYDGRLDVLMDGYDKPIGSTQISPSACYKVLPVGDDTLITASKRAKDAVVIWKIQFDDDGMMSLVAKANVESTPQNSRAPFRFELEESLDGFNGAATSLAYSQSTNTLAAVGKTGVVKLWNTGNWETKIEQTLPTPATDIVFISDHRQMVVSGGDGCTLISVNSQSTKEYKFRSESFLRLEVVEDNGSDYVIALTDEGILYKRFMDYWENNEKNSYPKFSVFRTDKGCLATSDEHIFGLRKAKSADDEVVIIKIGKDLKTEVRVFELPDVPQRICYSGYSKELLVAFKNQLFVIDPATNRLNASWRLPDYTDNVTAAIYWPARNVYLAATETGLVHLFVPERTTPLETFFVSSGAVNDLVATGPDQLITASSDDNQSLKRWKVGINPVATSKAREAGKLNSGTLYSGPMDSVHPWDQVDVTERFGAVSEQLSSRKTNVAKDRLVDGLGRNYTVDKARKAIQDLVRRIEEFEYPLDRYAGLNAAFEMAMEIGDGATSFHALAKLDAYFDIDFWKRAKLALPIGIRKAREEPQLKAMSEGIHYLVQRALREKMFAVAADYNEKAITIGRKLKNANSLQSYMRESELFDLQKTIESLMEIADSKKRLYDLVSTRPDDGDANTKWGNYLFLVEDDVENAARFWSKGDQVELKEIGILEELLSIDDRRAMLELSQKWLEFSEGSETLESEKAKSRALRLADYVQQNSTGELNSKARKLHSTIRGRINQKKLLRSLTVE